MFIYQTKAHTQALRKRLMRGEGDDRRLAEELNAAAEKAVREGPWSVTYDIPKRRASADPHDYYSEAPYWWPDPANPGGAFLRRDGEIYPGRYNVHRRALIELSNAVLTLCAAGYYLGRDPYLDRAVLLLDTWFVCPETRMNPSLSYAQAIKGVCTGRGIGMIELGNLDRIVHAAAFLEEYPAAAQVLKGFRAWLADMLDWSLHSEYGLAESRNGNNHETWWNVHAGTYAAWLGRGDVLSRVFENYKARVLSMLEADGSMPKELARTKSLHYSLFNLDAMAAICELGVFAGEDLWRYETPDGKSIGRAIDFLLPFIDNPYLWEHPEIEGDQPQDTYALQMAALRLGRADCAQVNQKRSSGLRLIRGQRPFGPLALLPGWAGSSTELWINKLPILQKKKAGV